MISNRTIYVYIYTYVIYNHITNRVYASIYAVYMPEIRTPILPDCLCAHGSAEMKFPHSLTISLLVKNHSAFTISMGSLSL